MRLGGGPGQTARAAWPEHDDCLWLNEKDREKQMPGNRRDQKRSGRPPFVSAHQRGHVHWKQNARIKYRSRYDRDRQRHRLVRRVVLGRDAALVRLRLVWLVVRLGALRGAIVHRTHVVVSAARHTGLWCRRDRRAEPDRPRHEHQTERRRERALQKAPHGSSMLRCYHRVKRRLAQLPTPEAQLRTTPYFQLPIPNSQLPRRINLGTGDRELGVVGGW